MSTSLAAQRLFPARLFVFLFAGLEMELRASCSLSIQSRLSYTCGVSLGLSWDDEDLLVGA